MPNDPRLALGTFAAGLKASFRVHARAQSRSASTKISGLVITFKMNEIPEMMRSLTRLAKAEGQGKITDREYQDAIAKMKKRAAEITKACLEKTKKAGPIIALLPETSAKGSKNPRKSGMESLTELIKEIKSDSAAIMKELNAAAS